MPELRCSKCQSTSVVPRARLIDRGHLDLEGDLKAAVYEDPNALFFKGAHRTAIFARVCADCGFAELYADNARQMYEAYVKSERESGDA